MQQPQQQQQMMNMNMIPQFPPNNITTEQIQKYLDENKTLILAILDNQNLGKLAECAQYQAQLQKNLMYLAAIADAQPQAPAMTSQMPQHPAMQQEGIIMQHPQAALSQQPTGFPPKAPLQFNPQLLQEQQRQQLQHQHQQPTGFPPKSHLQLNPQLLQEQQRQLQHQHQQALHSHMGIRPGVNNGSQRMHTESNLGAGSSGGPSSAGGLTGLADFSRSGAGPGAVTSSSAGTGGDAAGGASNSPQDANEGKQDGQEAGSGEGQGNSAAAGHNSANGELSHMKGSEDPK